MPEITKDGNYKKISALVDDWLEIHKGENFDLDLICRQLQIAERDNRKIVAIKLAYEVKHEKLEKSNRIYRYIDNTVKYIDWTNTTIKETLAIKWPCGRDRSRFGFDGHVCISPGDIAVVAGTSNMGKTTLILNLLWENMDDFPCILMGNEYTPSKFRRRVSRMTWKNPIGEDGKPKFELVERRDNWKDIIQPDKINMIDWVALPGNELYNIGKVIEGIQSKLRDGIAVIVLQKDETAKLGRGRSFSEELSSFYLVIDKGRLTVRKVKEWYEHNPNGEVYGFDIENGGTEFHRIRKLNRCFDCHGTGQMKGGECFACGGSGYVDAVSIKEQVEFL